MLWFALLLLEVVPRSYPLTFVCRAVMAGGTALVHTTGMMLVFLYAFAIVGFVFFPNLFQLRKVRGGVQRDMYLCIHICICVCGVCVCVCVCV